MGSRRLAPRGEEPVVETPPALGSIGWSRRG